jgi:tRNA(Ile)-lysidine synthase
VSNASAIALTSTRFTRSLEKRVLRYVNARRILSAGERVVVAVSGGPDSTTLLLILSHLATDIGVTLVAAHFDHMIRSRAEARADADFVRALCDEAGVDLRSGRADVRARAKKRKESLEEAARIERYQFLVAEAARADASAVGVGHTLDDRAETVLLHILRGAGLDGLAAMPPRSAWPLGDGPDVARPLLELRREDTVRYCRESGVEPRNDPTNDLPIATRNRVRHELLPVMRSFNPRIEEALVRLAEAAATDAEALERAADQAWETLAEPGVGEVRFDPAALGALPQAITARLLQRATDILSPGSSAEAGHIAGITAGLGKPRLRLSLPGDLQGVTRGRRLIIRHAKAAVHRPIEEQPLPAGGRAEAGDWSFTIKVLDGPAVQKAASPSEAYIDRAALVGSLRVRSRRPGDRLRPLGLGGTKKVQDILVDAKVPAEDRDQVPIIEDDVGIVWVVGHCIDERVAVTPRTARMIGLSAQRNC